MVFLPKIPFKKPLLLLVDGHISHQSIQTLFCSENDIDIKLHYIPPTCFIQHFDVGVFKTMKAEWRAAVKMQNETEIVTKRIFAKTFKDAKEETVSKLLPGKAFKTYG